MGTAPPGSGAMFDAIADRYDLLNRVISFGVDRRWRARTVAALALSGPARVLDVATGTADLAIAIAKAYPSARVVGLDPSPRMLAIGAAKIERAGLGERIELVEGDAQALPFDDASFDACSIAFGIRNVPDRDRGLREMARVTKPGGRVVVLELSEPRRGALAPLARFHVHTVVPSIGALLSGAREYRYLSRSIEAFPPAEEVAARMSAAGLDVRAVEPMTFGTCTLYVAERRAA
ncbi:MAG TPA: bifunctional demethylmenaquinone methyltransferase/2-methoxy-6-polyprenyl-1,4-benzoquinol methylase UbiE [Sandaracinaceae bacterium]